jgi:hypothetical protein
MDSRVYWSTGFGTADYETVVNVAHQGITQPIIFARVALNFLKLATGITRQVGSANPVLGDAIKRRLHRTSNPDKIEELKARLRRIPTICELTQNIRLYDREPPPPQSQAEQPGTPKTPHWRKGHWRRVAIGQGRKDRKSIFIRPVLVNAHLLPG